VALQFGYPVEVNLLELLGRVPKEAGERRLLSRSDAEEVLSGRRQTNPADRERRGTTSDTLNRWGGQHSIAR
jgi:hypothetical protein